MKTFNFMYTNFLECIERIEKLDFLIRIERTGSPSELAENLNLSERQIYRLINFMKDIGADIKYNFYKQSYVYIHPVKFQFGFIK